MNYCCRASLRFRHVKELSKVLIQGRLSKQKMRVHIKLQWKSESRNADESDVPVKKKKKNMQQISQTAELLWRDKLFKKTTPGHKLKMMVSVEGIDSSRQTSPWERGGMQASRCTRTYRIKPAEWRRLYCTCENKPTDSFRLQISGVFKCLQERKGGGEGG